MPILATYVIEFILITAATLYTQHLIALEKLRQYNFESMKLLRTLESQQKLKCLNLQKEIDAIQRNIDYNNAQYLKNKKEIDKLNRKRLDLEDLLDDSKRTLAGVKSASANQQKALVRHLDSKAPKTGPTYGGLLIGALLAFVPTLAELIYEKLRSLAIQRELAKEIEKLLSECGLFWQETGTPGPGCVVTPQGSKSFKNPVNGPAKIRITGTVDDDIVINGSVYQPGAHIYDCGLNGAHFVDYEATVQAGEVTTVSFNDNHAGKSDININITYTAL